jgi:type IV secretory pathway TrbD component
MTHPVNHSLNRPLLLFGIDRWLAVFAAGSGLFWWVFGASFAMFLDSFIWVLTIWVIGLALERFDPQWRVVLLLRLGLRDSYDAGRRG